MGQGWQSDTTVPESRRKGLELLCTQLRDALGEQLVAVILYGGLAKGEYAPASSDVNVMGRRPSHIPPTTYDIPHSSFRALRPRVGYGRRGVHRCLLPSLAVTYLR